MDFAKTLVKFPVGTTYITERDGEFLVLVQGPIFIRLVLKGKKEYPHSPILLSRDFRRPAHLFAWLGSGATVRFETPEPEVLKKVATQFGTWRSELTLCLH